MTVDSAGLLHSGNRAPILDDHLVVFDREARDVVFGRVLIGVTAERSETKKCVQHFLRYPADRHFGDVDIARVAIRRRADLELAIEEAAPKSRFLQRHAHLDPGDVVLDRDERFPAQLSAAGDEVIDVGRAELDSVRVGRRRRRRGSIFWRNFRGGGVGCAPGPNLELFPAIAHRLLLRLGRLDLRNFLRLRGRHHIPDPDVASDEKSNGEEDQENDQHHAALAEASAASLSWWRFDPGAGHDDVALFFSRRSWVATSLSYSAR